MKKLLLITLVFICFGCKNNSEIKTETTTYYFIRHAEKDKSDKTNKNPKLTEKGLKRAKNWQKHFKNIGFDAIYSTNYFRTMQTAQPTANANTLNITIYDPRNIDYEAFQNQTKNQTILVVGHSNTTPAFVNKIIGEDKYKSIDETINSNLYTVTIKNDKIIENLTTVN